MFDPELKDTENVPIGMEIDDYMATDVLPYAPDAVVDGSVRDEPKFDNKTGLTATEQSASSARPYRSTGTFTNTKGLATRKSSPRRSSSSRTASARS